MTIVASFEGSVPATMRAAVIDETGPPEVLYLADIPTPTAISAELLVRIEAAGVNPIDTKTRAGGGVSAAIPSFPCVLGSDFSGVVVETPYDYHPLQPGDEVYGMLPVPRMAGSYAQFAAVSSLNVARRPRNLNAVEAAGVPVAALTAWGAVADTADVGPRDRVLIHAGAGGVGHFAVQFAKLRGAEVFATASGKNVEWLRELGADHVIDYTTIRFDEVLRNVDTVIDLIGNTKDQTGTRSLKVMRAGGLLVNVPSGSWPTLLEDTAAAGIRASHYKVAGDTSTLGTITRLIEEGSVSVFIEQVFPLERIADAHRHLEEGHTRGKIVINMGPVSA